MKRRAFVRAVVGLMAAPLTAKAEDTRNAPRIAVITTSSPENSRTVDGLLRGLRERGYVEGKNIHVEIRWGRGSTDRFPAFAAELVRLNVRVIVAGSSAAGRAVQRATRSVPIVIPTMGDPVGEGFVASLARPGGNITGLTRQDVIAKQIQLIKEAIPSASSVTIVVDTTEQNHRHTVSEAERAARALGVALKVEMVSHGNDFAGAFTRTARAGGGPVLVVGGTLASSNRARLVEESRKSHLPVMCPARPDLEVGCLMGYSPDVPELFRRAAAYVDKILKGANPGELPVEQAGKFDLIINLKTAKTLDLTIPQSLLLRADQVID
jgi:ABC-type uncharacterized transport system substrate-binding protein